MRKNLSHFMPRNEPDETTCNMAGREGRNVALIRKEPRSRAQAGICGDQRHAVLLVLQLKMLIRRPRPRRSIGVLKKKRHVQTRAKETFFLAAGAVSRYLRSLGSDWRDGAGGPADEADAPGERSALPFARAATAAEPIDMPPEAIGGLGAAGWPADDDADGCWAGGVDGFDETVDAERRDDGVGGDDETGAARCCTVAALDVWSQWKKARKSIRR